MDKNLLKALSQRDRFLFLSQSVPREMFDPLTGNLLDWYKVYFSRYPEHSHVNFDALETMMKLSTQETPDQLALLTRITNALKEPVDDSVLNQVANQLEEVRFAGEAGRILSAYNNGEEVDVTFELQRLAADARHRLVSSGGNGWANADPLEYLEGQSDDAGLQFRAIAPLASTLRGLLPGDNIAIAAPTDSGKSSLLVRLAVDFAQQAKERNLYPERPLLYLVNESTAEALAPRAYGTALQRPRSELLTLARAGELVPLYSEIVGRWDAIGFQNIHGMNTTQVAQIIEAHNPYAVFTDMTGRIQTVRPSSNETIQAEMVWNTMRELAAMQKFAHVGTIQVSAEGMDMLHPPITALQNSKVGVQTTLDLLLIMGKLFREDMEVLRGFSTPKNKLVREGCGKHNRLSGFFQPELNQWVDFKEVPAG